MQTDSQIPLTDRGSAKSDIAAASEGKDYTLQFCDGDKTVFILAGGELSIIGKITEDGFKKISDAESHRGNPRAVRRFTRWR